MKLKPRLLMPKGRHVVIGVPFLWLFMFFVLPFAIVLKISFAEADVAIPPYTEIYSYVDQQLQILLNLGNYMMLVGDELYLGVLYLCALPATVQSAIAFTSLARGNVPAAICSAAASSLLGIVLTPLLVMVLMGVQGDTGSNLDAVFKIVLQLLVPFVAGQLARRWIGAWVARNARWLKLVDQGSILLVVYTAFSDAVISGLWHAVPPARLVGLALVCCVLLAVVLGCTQALGKRLGFCLEDRITLLFAGSKKSMATGVPMAQVLFAGGAIGAVILPLMLFHQIQLMVCAVLAQRYAAREEATPVANA